MPTTLARPIFTWPAEARLARAGPRHRGTMVTYAERDADANPSDMLGGHEARDKARRAGRRRASTGGVAAIGKRHVPASPNTVYQVLIALLFATFGFRQQRSEQAMNTLFSLTSSKGPLTRRDARLLETSFNVMYSGMDHLFMPWRPVMQGDAAAYLDIPYIADAVLALEREATLDLPREEVRRLRDPVTRFLKMVGVSRRTTA